MLQIEITSEVLDALERHTRGTNSVYNPINMIMFFGIMVFTSVLTMAVLPVLFPAIFHHLLP